MKKLVEKALLEAFGSLKNKGEIREVPDVEVSVPDARFGDYSTNAALVMAKAEKKNPRELAEKIAAEILSGQHVIFESVSVAGGFINFTLSSQALSKNISTVIEQGQLYGCSIFGGGKTVVFEYSSPNTNKALHIGHTRNDLYGKACINLLRAIGYKVVSSEIINDRGIHIMKSMLMYQKHGQGRTPELENIKPDHFVGKYYSLFGKEASESPEKEKVLMDEAQELLRKWEAGDPGTRTLWKQMNDWWYEGVKQTYEREGTAFDEVDYESGIYDKGRELVFRGVEKGIFQKEEDGSVSVEFEDKNLGKKYLLRKDGTTIYITQDMFLWDLRARRHNPHMAIVTTAAEQAYHFNVLKQLFKLLGYEWAENFRHLPYEHVFLGKSKMSSRDGRAVSADELVDHVKSKVRELMQGLEKLKGSAEDDRLVEAVAYGAIKYGYLKYEPNTRMYFDLDTTITLEGNTGIYIQYAHARIRSILEKVNISRRHPDLSAIASAAAEESDDEGSLVAQDNINSPSPYPERSPDPAETNLARMLVHYGEAVENAALEYKPNLLCNYLYDLAGTFSAFYNDVPVLQEPDSDKRSFRLDLLAATAQVIKNGLELLGIETPSEM